MLNRVVLVGRLTKDPELRRTTNEVAVASFTLAVDNRGTKEKSTSFINCVVWNAQADNVCKFTRKGSLVGVDGRLVTRSYDRKDGTKAYLTEVVCDSVTFLEPKGTNTGKEEIPQKEESRNLDAIDIVDDDLPF